MVSAVNETLCAWRSRSSASVSATLPVAAAFRLVTVCQPRVGVLIWLTEPLTAAIGPVSAQVAVTVTNPVVAIVTLAGRFQITLLLSLTEPLTMVVPGVPPSCKSTVELVAGLRTIPLIFTLRVSASPTAVDGENEL